MYIRVNISIKYLQAIHLVIEQSESEVRDDGRKTVHIYFPLQSLEQAAHVNQIDSHARPILSIA